MQIALLKKNAQVRLAHENGHLTTATIHGRDSIGFLTDAGVYRPITRGQKKGTLLSREQFFTVLPQYLSFAQELIAQQIVESFQRGDPARTRPAQTDAGF